MQRNDKRMWGAGLLAALVLSACGGSDTRSANPAGHTLAAPGEVTAQGATVTVDLRVPEDLRSAPFDVRRQLRVPQGYAISVFARIEKARFMAVAPNGDVLVSQPSTGRILLVRGGGEAGAVSTFASGLSNPHDMVFHRLNGTTYLFVAESGRVTRSVYQAGDTTRRAASVVVDHLPDNSTPELRGAYAHALKNIALSGNALYVSIASATNSDPRDLSGSPKRAAIYRYDALGAYPDPASGTLFAQGIRNAEGLDIAPNGDLWAVVNNRDNIAYPFHDDWDGDGTDDYGKVIQSYVDNHPPEEFLRVREGGNYGWPFCNPNPDAGLNNMPFDRDVQNNPDGSKLNCDTADRVDKGIQAHSAPLGLSFLQGSRVPEPYRGGAVTALHGCWNCSKFVGHKVVFFPWENGRPGTEQDLVSGWVTNAANKERWGRPVDAVADQDGNFLISDDYAGAIYKLSKAAPSGENGPRVASFTLVNAETGQPIAGYDPLPNGATLDRGALPPFSVRANTAPGTVGSVRFELSGGARQTENYRPYALLGDQNGGKSYTAWQPAAGPQSITATAYGGAGASGAAGSSLTLNLTIK